MAENLRNHHNADGNMNDLRETVRGIIQVLQAQQQREQNSATAQDLNHIDELLKIFHHHHPPTFKGSKELVEAKNWIMQLEKTFCILGYSSHEKVLLMEYRLKGEADGELS